MAEVYLFLTLNFPVIYKKVINEESFCRFSSLKPNITHEILKDLESVGKVGCIVTQNVDNLHSKAGSKKVIELHGTAFKVMCLNCDHKICRYELQEVFQKLNPSMVATTQMIRPDGDVELSQVKYNVYSYLCIYVTSVIYVY